jgi:hypothetical protein
MVLFSLSDDLYFNPDSSFPQELRTTMNPYHIFTGVGTAITIETNGFTREIFYFIDRNPQKRLIKEKGEIIKVEECFYAYLVQQSKPEVELALKNA